MEVWTFNLFSCHDEVEILFSKIITEILVDCYCSSTSYIRVTEVDEKKNTFQLFKPVNP